MDAAVEDIKTRNRFGDEELDRALAEQGLDRAAFRAQIRRELETYQVMQAKVRGRVKVSDDDLRNYYQTHPQEFGGEPEIHVRHIFLPLAGGRDARRGGEGPRRRASRCSQRLKAGEDFAQVAREVSKGPSAAGRRRPRLAAPRHDPEGARGRGVRAQGRPGLRPRARRARAPRREGRGRAALGGAKSFEDAKEEIRNRLLEEQVGQTRAQVSTSCARPRSST